MASLQEDCLRFLSQALELVCFYSRTGLWYETYCKTVLLPNWPPMVLALALESCIVMYCPYINFIIHYASPIWASWAISRLVPSKAEQHIVLSNWKYTIDIHWASFIVFRVNMTNKNLQMWIHTFKLHK